MTIDSSPGPPDRTRRSKSRSGCRCPTVTNSSQREPARPGADRREPLPVPHPERLVRHRPERRDRAGPGSRHALLRPATSLRGRRPTARSASVEAYCPHQGAHLGVGARVEGDCLRCPFHGWAFEGDTGKCVDIPYAETERIPARSTLRVFPTIERNGFVWAWHHLEGGDPFYDVREVPEFDDPAWLPPLVSEFNISTACQEMAENNHDFAHFKFVHGQEEVPEGEEFIDGTYKRTRTRASSARRSASGSAWSGCRAS